MKITKIGHCCLIIEVNGKRIMTDPGLYSTSQTNIKNLDIVLITHEHPDHIHVESFKKVLENNPDVLVVTNRAVNVILKSLNIDCKILENGEEDILGVSICAQSCEHADIYDGVVPVLNTGYFIDNRFLIPGDAWLEFKKPVEILALPIVAPWLKVRDAMNYAFRLQPKIIIPIHDGGAKDLAKDTNFRMYTNFCAQKGLDFRPINEGEILEC